MTDEQIIKEYQEFVNSVNSGGKGEIAQGRFGDILDIIIRQKAEIERLKNQNTLLLKKKCKDMNTARKIIKSEAIKEFAERLIRTADGDDEYGTVFVFNIEDLVKEMTKGE